MDEYGAPLWCYGMGGDDSAGSGHGGNGRLDKGLRYDGRQNANRWTAPVGDPDATVKCISRGRANWSMGRNLVLTPTHIAISCT